MAASSSPSTTTKKKRSKVLWTGFGPFGDPTERVGENPTAVLAEDVARHFNDAWRVLEVSTACCDQVLPILDAHDLCIHLGVAAPAKNVTLERCAHNEADFRCEDERGCQLSGEPVDPKDPETKRATRVDVDAAAAALQKRGIEVDVSEDPGRFVCNYLYFRSLASSCRSSSRRLFVHVPPFAKVPKDAQRRTLEALREILLPEDNDDQDDDEAPPVEEPRATSPETRATSEATRAAAEETLVAALVALGIDEARAARAAAVSDSVEAAMEHVFSAAEEEADAADAEANGDDDDARQGSGRRTLALYDEAKLVLVVNLSLDMSKGKAAAQTAHAALGAYRHLLERDPDLALRWAEAGEKIVVVGTPVLGETNDGAAYLRGLADRANAARLATYLVRDAGRTEVAPGAETVLAVGPALASRIDPITGHLRLL